MRVKTGALSRTGARENNQDAMGVFAEDLVFAVADGMGGLEHGERMSAAAIDAVRARAPRLHERARAMVADGTAESRAALFKDLEALLNDTAGALFAMA